MAQFERGVETRKILLSILIPFGLVIRILTLVLNQEWKGWPSCGVMDSTVWGWVNLGFMATAAAIQILHLCPWSYDHPKYQRHSNVTLTHFYAITFSVITYVMPSLLYVLQYRQRLPARPTTWESAPIFSGLRLAEFISVLLSFVTIGTMRRGPELYYDAHKLTIGYGWAMEAKNVQDEPARKPGRFSKLVAARTRRWKKDISAAKSSAEEEEREDAPLLGSSSATSPTAYSPATPRSLDEKDDAGEPIPNVLDYYQCSIFGLLLIQYIWPIAAMAAKQPELRPEDLPHMPEALRSENVILPRSNERFVLTPEELEEKEWNDQQGISEGANGQPNKPWTPWTLLKEVCRGQAWLILSSVVFEWLYNASTFLPRYCMHEIIQSFEGHDRRSDMTYAYLMAFGLFFGSFVGNLLSSFSRIRENIVNHKAIRVNLRTMLFHKILMITDDQSPDATGTGRAQILNLMNVDVGVIAGLATRILGLSNAVLMLGLSGGFLYSMFSWSAFVAMGTVPLMAPFTGYVARLTYKCDQALAKARDARIGAMREMLISVKVIKLNAWEEHHLRRISELRAKEVRLQRWRYMIGSSFNILALLSPIVGLFAMFASYTKLQGGVLTPASAFVATTVFRSVQDALGEIPEIVQKLLMALVSLRRLCKFLNSDMVEHTNRQVGSTILLEDATVTWPARELEQGEIRDREPFRLTGMTLKIPDEARFVLVCGATGAGKTLFLLSLLGEAKLLGGCITAPKSRYGSIPLADELGDISVDDSKWIDEATVAYAAQIPYITHGSLREMILFGLPYVQSRYESVVQQCGLASDFAMFTNGDQEEIGASGVTLSGGQRARLSLARAVYSRAGTLLIDDVLSALDATTSQYVYAHCIRGSLLRKRRIIMVSHNVSLLLPASDLAIQLKDGRIARSGPPSDLREALLQEEDHAINEEFDTLLPPDVSKPQSIVVSTSSRRIYEEEHQEKGNVRLSNYGFVIRNVGGKGYWIGLLLLIAAPEFFRIIMRFVVKRWSAEPSRNDYWIKVWAIVAGSRILGTSAMWFWLYGNKTGGFTQRGAAKMHNAMVDGILNAPLRYFDRTPEGRILNRFSNDVQKLDGFIPDSFGRTIMQSLSMTVNIVILGINLPPVAIACAVFAYPFDVLRKFFGRMRASLARLDAVLASPISGLTYETIGSIVTIRAFGSSRFLCQLFATFEDVGNRMSMAGWAVWIAFSSVMLTINSLLLGASGFFLLSSNYDAATAGFILTFALDLSSQMFWLLDRIVNLEEHMVSVERIAEVAKITPEAEGEEHFTVPQDWPQAGEIVCEKLAVRYASDLPLVLRGVSFVAQPGERVCIVGRTGSGKSSTALALLRDLSASSGSIKIDGIDIARVPLHLLRSKLSYIPQESLLTSGTLRDALDITGEKDDYELYAAMERVHLDITAGSPFSDLNTLVSAGLNFSLGERQLMVLARALLKSAKVIIMDEATSSIDYETDAKVTTAIQEMKGVTVITIAHRPTLIALCLVVIDYDRVLVLKDGVIVENDSPAALVVKDGSEFQKLCMADGPIEYQQLLSMARPSKNGDL